MVYFVLIIIFQFKFVGFSLQDGFSIQKISDKSMFLLSNMVCFVLIIVIWFVFFNSSLLVSHFKIVVVKQKNLNRTCFCFRTWFVLLWLLCIDFCCSIQVCWFLTSRWLFLNNKNIRKEHVFVFEYGLFCLDYYFSIQVCWFLTSRWFLNTENIRQEFFCFRTWFVLFWLLWFDLCFSIQVCWFLTSRLLLLNQKNLKRTCFCFRTWFFLLWLLCIDFCFSIQVCWFLTSRWLFLNNKNIRKEHVFVFEYGLFCLDYYFWIQIGWFLTSGWLFLNKQIGKEHVCALQHGLFCFDYCVSIFVFQFKFVGFSLQDGFLIQKISDKSMFLLSNMVCFVLIIVVWFVFFNSSLLVSHFKIVVVKQKIWNKHVFVFEHGLFCFDYCVLIIVFQFKFVGFSLQDSCF